MNNRQKRAVAAARDLAAKRYFEVMDRVLSIEDTVRYVSWMQDENRSRLRSALSSAAGHF